MANKILKLLPFYPATFEEGYALKDKYETTLKLFQTKQFVKFLALLENNLRWIAEAEDNKLEMTINESRC